MGRQITIHDCRDESNQADQQNHKHAMRTIERALQQIHGDEKAIAEVYLNNRGVYASSPKWLEHVIRIQYGNGGALHMGAIQREPGAESEFHS